MKKILSVMLIFVLSLFVLGTTDLLKAEATTDVTIYLHVHQYDGDYTNTGTGIWDGVNWNNWADVVTSEDDFGGVIAKTYTAAEINAVSDSVEFKPTRDVNVDDAMNYLAPASVEGKVFADVTSLKDGSETELHLYYVEGALDFYVVEGAPTLGYIFVVYADPKVAADAMAYDAWNMWTWNNGSGGSVDGVDFALDLELEADGYVIPMKLGVLGVSDSADQNSGFIVRTEDWAKQCGSDILIDNTEIRGEGALFYLYQAGSCELETDYSAWLSDVAMKFDLNSGNRFVEGTVISAPNQLDITLLMEKMPEDLMIDRFTVKDADGNIIPITSVDTGITPLVGMYQSSVQLRTETHVIVFVDTAVDHTKIGLVGNVQGWSPENAIMSLGDDVNGYAVFEFTSFEANAEFKILYNPLLAVDDPLTTEVDETVNFAWGDAELIGSNTVVDLSVGGTIQVYFDDANDVTAVVDANPIDVDITAYTYTSAVSCATGENLFTLFLATALDPTKIGVVGSIQVNDWTPSEAIMYSDVTAEGYVVFEVCMTDTNVEYKVLYNPNLAVDDPLTTEVDETVVFAWGDRELVQSNTVVDFGEGTTDGEIAHLINGPITVLGDYVPTLTAQSTYLLSIYMNGNVDWSKVGIVGTVQGNQWTPGEAITYSQMDAFGNAIFDIEIDMKNEEYLVLYDANDNGFDWDDKISGDANIAVALGENTSLVQYAMIDETMAMTFEDLGPDLSGMYTTTVSLMFPDNTFMNYEEYYVEYIDGYEVAQAPGAEVFISEYIEGTSNNKAIELFNPQLVDVDLTGYVINYYNNGSATVTKSFDLTGITLVAGGTFVLCTDTYANQDDCDEVQVYADLDAVVFFNGDDALELVKDGTVIDVIGLVGEDPGTNWPVGDGFTSEFTLRRAKEVAMGNTVFTAAEWDVFPQNTFDGLGTHEYEDYMVPVVIMSDVLPFGLSNDFVEGNPVDGMGTYAVTPTSIMIELLKSEAPLSSLVLKDGDGNVVAVESYDNAYMIGDYTKTRYCKSDELLYFIHIKLTDTVVTDKSQLGVVGTINGWDIANAVTARGMDSEGNWVFEVCLNETATGGEFKVKFDKDMDGFTWDGGADPELTPGNVVFDVANGPHFFVEENESALNVSNTHMIMLTEANKLDITKDYYLEFEDANGFMVMIPVDMDTEAPHFDFAVIPGVSFVFDNAGTFDLMDYYSKLDVIDNREGEMDYVVETALVPSTLGLQTVVISATDSWNNKSTLSINITVVDTTPPTITGDTAVEFDEGSEAPNWASYVTVTGGTLTVNTTQVDMDTPGSFFVIFTAEDPSGNKATHTLEVTINAVEVPKTGCFSTFNGVSALFITVTLLMGASVLYFVRKR